MKYPKHEIYEKVYKRYFEKGVEYLIKPANVKKEDKILDICGGNGRLSKELKKYSKDVTYLDQEADMIPQDLAKNEIKIYNMSIQEFVDETYEKFDKVFCQQAINYWLLKSDLLKFSKIFNENAIFVFNTFSNKPSKTPTIKEYEIEGNKYVEISYLVGNSVNHIQIREGYEPHFTKFDWIPKEKYIDLLSPYFDIEIKNDGKTSIYVCRKK